MKKSKYERMNKSTKTKWLKALRSDKYRQGVGALRFETDDCTEENSAHQVYVEHCCLGVLCEVTKKRRRTWADLGMLPPKYLKDFNLSEEVQSKLADFNDESRWSFKRIANWIEKNL